MRIKQFGFAGIGLAGALALAGCLSASDQDDGSNSGSRYQMSGAVVDGRVAGAVVWVDLNDNGRLDGSEPSALTDRFGFYSYRPEIRNSQGETVAAARDYCREGPARHCLRMRPGTISADTVTVRAIGGFDLATQQPLSGVLSTQRGKPRRNDGDNLAAGVITPGTSLGLTDDQVLLALDDIETAQLLVADFYAEIEAVLEGDLLPASATTAALFSLSLNELVRLLLQALEAEGVDVDAAARVAYDAIATTWQEFQAATPDLLLSDLLKDADAINAIAEEIRSRVSGAMTGQALASRVTIQRSIITAEPQAPMATQPTDLLELLLTSRSLAALLGQDGVNGTQSAPAFGDQTQIDTLAQNVSALVDAIKHELNGGELDRVTSESLKIAVTGRDLINQTLTPEDLEEIAGFATLPRILPEEIDGTYLWVTAVENDQLRGLASLFFLPGDEPGAGDMRGCIAYAESGPLGDPDAEVLYLEDAGWARLNGATLQLDLPLLSGRDRSVTMQVLGGDNDDMPEAFRLAYRGSTLEWNVQDAESAGFVDSPKVFADYAADGLSPPASRADCRALIQAAD